jgi:hypothetical protein
LSIQQDQKRLALSENDRAVESVRSAASNLLAAFKVKLERLEGNGEVSQLFLRQGYNAKHCIEEAKKFFATDQVRYLAVDGTEFFEERLDMNVFYAGAFAYSGATKFQGNEIISEAPASQSDYFSLSSAIPLSEEYSSEVFGEKHGAGTEFDASKVSAALMRLSEYFIVYETISRDPRIRIILMDRTISADIAHISWKLRDYIQEDLCKLMGYKTKFGAVSKTDLELGRMLVRNDQLGIPAARSQFLKFATIALLLKEGRPLTVKEIMKALKLKEERKPRVEDVRSKAFSDAFVENSNENFQLSETTGLYFERLLEATTYFVNHIFKFSGEGHPLRVKDFKTNFESWLKCEDIDYLTLTLITAILYQCWGRNILLLGIVKDSAANELVRGVVPVLQDAGLLTKTSRIEKFESDTMLLQANSIVNGDSLACPWRTFEYDVCFRTIGPLSSKSSSTEKGEAWVKGAYKNVIAPERMFVKAYFQLWCSDNNPTVRSHVFLYDRPCYPQYDNVRELVLKNQDQVEEEILPSLHFLSDSPISELIIAILDSMGKEPIPEALGHNYPLFLADKRAKVGYDEASRSCVAAVDLEITKSRLDQQILFQGKFRSHRSAIESARKKKPSPK